MIAVVGAGWAGLAAAVELARTGHDVELFEAARQPGGRARSVTLDGRVLDNGQHICIGAYDAVLALGRTLGLAESRMFTRLPLKLIQRDQYGIQLSLYAPDLMPPFNLLAAMGALRGLRAPEVYALMRGLYRLRRAPAIDCPVDDFLAAAGQPQRLNDLMWHPLCIATLNTPPDRASAQVFAEVLARSFTLRRRASDLLLPAGDLGSVLPAPALEFLEQHGATVHLGTRVRELVVENGRARGVRMDAGLHPADAVVLALPPDATARLVEPHLPELAQRCQEFSYQPIATVYLSYDASVRLDPPLQGFCNSTVQWVIDRRVSGTPGLMAAVVSSEGAHTGWSADELAGRVTAELAACFPHWPAPAASRVVREKHATFAAVTGINALRPESKTALEGLWLAGDWTQTGLPATLEGAVRSGYTCVQHINEGQPA